MCFCLFCGLPTLIHAWNETFLAQLTHLFSDTRSQDRPCVFPLMAQLLPVVTMTVNRQVDDSKWQRGRTTGNASLSSPVSLPFLDESCAWLGAIIMGIQGRATTHALFSDLNFNILSHWNAHFGFPLFVRHVWQPENKIHGSGQLNFFAAC